MKNHSVLFVSPVMRVASQGRDKQVFHVMDPKTRQVTPTKNMQKTREVGTSVTLKFPLDVYQNKYITGLDEMIPNPFLSLDPETIFSNYALSNKWSEIIPKLVKQEKISRQTYFEILDNVDPDYYTSAVKQGSMLSFQPSQLLNRESSFIERFSIELFDRPNRFVDDTPRQRMAIQLIKVHNRIAKSKNEANPVEHLFYISEENEAEMERMRKQDIIDRATYEKVKLQEESGEFTNYKVASLLILNNGVPLIKGTETRDGVKQALNRYLGDRTYQLDNINKFNKVISLLKSPEGKARFEVMYLIQQGLNAKVLDVKDGYTIWNSKSAIKDKYKWSDHEKFVNFILSEMLVFDPNNDDTSITNWYNELYKEVKSKNVWLD